MEFEVENLVKKILMEYLRLFPSEHFLNSALHLELWLVHEKYFHVQSAGIKKGYQNKSNFGFKY